MTDKTMGSKAKSMCLGFLLLAIFAGIAFAGGYCVGWAHPPGFMPDEREQTIKTLQSELDNMQQQADNGELAQRRKKAETEISSLERETTELEKQRKKLEVELEDEQKEQRKLQEELEGTQEELDKLLTRLQGINRFNRAQFLLVSMGATRPTPIGGPSRSRSNRSSRPSTVSEDRAHFAVGLGSEKGGRFRVIAKASGQDAQRAARVCDNALIPRLTEAQDLTVKVHNSCEVDELLSPQIAGNLGNFWKEWRFGPFSSDELAEFVCFRDLETNQSRVGYYLDHDDTSLIFQPFADRRTAVPRSRIAVGSARKGSGDQLVAVAEEMSISDFCLLNMAHRLSMRRGKEGNVKLVVHTRLDFPVDFEREAGRFLTFLAGLEALGFKASGSLRVRSSLNVSLQMVADAIEDEAMAKFRSLGVPVYERERLMTILGERGLVRYKAFDQTVYSRMPTASHVALIEIGPSLSGAAFRITAKLIDLKSGDHLWSKSLDRAPTSSSRIDDWFLDSGRLVSINNEVRSSRKVGFGLRTKRPNPNSIEKLPPMLAYREDPNPATAGYVAIRDLFSKIPYKFKSARIEQKRSAYVDDIKQVPSDHLIRYVIWRIAKNALPPAGRVIEVQGNGADVSLGTLSGVSPGDKLRVMRLSTDNQGREMETMLPQELTVRLPSASLSTTTFGNTEIELLWSGNTKPEIGDIVILKKSKRSMIAFEPLKLIPPNEDDKKKLRFNNPVNVAKYGRIALEAATELSQRIDDAFVAKLHVNFRRVGQHEFAARMDRRRADPAQFTTIDLPNGTTHLIKGSVSVTTADRFPVELSIHRVHEDGTIRPIDKISVVLSKSQIENWQP